MEDIDNTNEKPRNGLSDDAIGAIFGISWLISVIILFNLSSHGGFLGFLGWAIIGLIPSGIITGIIYLIFKDLKKSLMFFGVVVLVLLSILLVKLILLG